MRRQGNEQEFRARVARTAWQVVSVAVAALFYFTLVADHLDGTFAGHRPAIGLLAILYVLWSVRQTWLRANPSQAPRAASRPGVEPGAEAPATLAERRVFGVPLYILVATQVLAATMFLATGVSVAAYICAIILVGMAGEAAIVLWRALAEPRDD